MRAKNNRRLLFVLPICIMLFASFEVDYKKENKMENQSSFKNLPVREGVKPKTTNTNPHTQLDQQPEDISFVRELSEWAFALENIEKMPSAISVPGAIAMNMEPEHACKSCNAFMYGTEFAHFHPHPDYSLHLGIPKEDAEAIIEKGWGEWHPLIAKGFLPPNIIMLYAPRNQNELEIAKSILKHSYDYAKGNIE